MDYVPPPDNTGTGADGSAPNPDSSAQASFGGQALAGGFQNNQQTQDPSAYESAYASNASTYDSSYAPQQIHGFQGQQYGDASAYQYSAAAPTAPSYAAVDTNLPSEEYQQGLQYQESQAQYQEVSQYQAPHQEYQGQYQGVSQGTDTQYVFEQPQPAEQAQSSEQPQVPGVASDKAQGAEYVFVQQAGGESNIAGPMAEPSVEAGNAQFAKSVEEHAGVNEPPPVSHTTAEAHVATEDPQPGMSQVESDVKDKDPLMGDTSSAPATETNAAERTSALADKEMALTDPPPIENEEAKPTSVSIDEVAKPTPATTDEEAAKSSSAPFTETEGAETSAAPDTEAEGIKTSTASVASSGIPSASAPPNITADSTPTGTSVSEVATALAPGTSAMEATKKSDAAEREREGGMSKATASETKTEMTDAATEVKVGDEDATEEPKPAVSDAALNAKPTGGKEASFSAKKREIEEKTGAAPPMKKRKVPEQGCMEGEIEGAEAKAETGKPRVSKRTKKAAISPGAKKKSKTSQAKKNEGKPSPAPSKKEKAAASKKAAAKPAPVEPVKHPDSGKRFGFGKPQVFCDVCFLEEDKEVGNTPLVKCTECSLLVHSACFSPTAIDENGYFLCNVCTAVKEASTPKEETKPTKKRTPKKRTTFVKKVKSPGPLPPTAEAKEDGRIYEHHEGSNMDVFCQLCARRDVIGGMKPTDFKQEGKTAWVHLACIMATTSAYMTKKGIVTGVERALRQSQTAVRKVEKETSTSVACEACTKSGGLLLRCEFQEKEGKVSGPRCAAFLHPLCAEITDRARIVKPTTSGDVISYKCTMHSYWGIDLCGVCNLGNKQNEMLECDGCRRGFHMGCLNPPLEKVPSGDWFCMKCCEEGKNH